MEKGNSASLPISTVRSLTRSPMRYDVFSDIYGTSLAWPWGSRGKSPFLALTDQGRPIAKRTWVLYQKRATFVLAQCDSKKKPARMDKGAVRMGKVTFYLLFPRHPSEALPTMLRILTVCGSAVDQKGFSLLLLPLTFPPRC